MPQNNYHMIVDISRMTFEGANISRRAVLGGAGLAMTAGAGCLAGALSPSARASDWPQQGYDAGHTNYKPTGSPPLDRPRLAWQAGAVRVTARDDDIGTGLRQPGMIVADGTIVTKRGTAIGLDTGDIRTRSGCFQDGRIGFARTESYTDGIIVSSTLDAGRQFGGPDGARLYGVRPSIPTGVGDRCENARRWIAGSPRDGSYQYTGTVDDGTVFGAVWPTEFGESRGAVVAFDADDGSRQWRTDVTLDVESVCADDERLFVTGSDGDLTIFERGSGFPKQGFAIDETDVLVAAREGTAYLRTSNRAIERQEVMPTLSAVDGSAGELSWRGTPPDLLESDDARPSFGGFAVGPDSVYVLIETRGGDYCVSLSTTDGSVQWSRSVSAAPWLVATDTSVYLSGGSVACLDSATGEERWTWSPPDDYIPGGPIVIANDRLLVPIDGRALYALEER